MLIVDTGVLLAAADTNDPDHQPCATLLEREPGPLVTTGMVIAEAGYLIDRQLGPQAEAAFFGALAEGDVGVEPLSAPDFRRISELVLRYSDLPLGGTDAGVVVLAERYEADRVATLDRRHFSVVQPAHGKPFTIVP